MVQQIKEFPTIKNKSIQRIKEFPIIKNNSYSFKESMVAGFMQRLEFKEKIVIITV